MLDGVECYVLNDRRRVVSATGMARALGLTRSSEIRRLMDSERMKPYDSGGLLAAQKFVEFIPLRGLELAHGYSAEVLFDVCHALVQACADRVLLKAQQRLAQRAVRLMTAFGKLGIIALIDEATGYERDREARELARLVDAYVAEDSRPWSRRFPPPFFREMCRLWGWRFEEDRHHTPRAAGRVINRYVYDQLPAGVRERLEHLNPADESGARRHRYHQHIKTGGALEHLDRQIHTVYILMRQANSRQEFEADFAAVTGPPRPVPHIERRQLRLFADLESKRGAIQ